MVSTLNSRIGESYHTIRYWTNGTIFKSVHDDSFLPFIHQIARFLCNYFTISAGNYLITGHFRMDGTVYLWHGRHFQYSECHIGQHFCVIAAKSIFFYRILYRSLYQWLFYYRPNISFGFFNARFQQHPCYYLRPLWLGLGIDAPCDYLRPQGQGFGSGLVIVLKC